MQGRLQVARRYHMTDDHGVGAFCHSYWPVSHRYLNFSDGQDAAKGSWAEGPTPDGRGEFTSLDGPDTSAPKPNPTHPDTRLYGTTELPNTVEKSAGTGQDKLRKE